MAPRSAAEEWQPVCALGDLEVERGVAALVHGQAVAMFRTSDDEVYVLGNHDPFAHASTIARGIVGVRPGVPFVASLVPQARLRPAQRPLPRRRPRRRPDYAVKVVDGVVHVGQRKAGPCVEPRLRPVSATVGPGGSPDDEGGGDRGDALVRGR